MTTSRTALLLSWMVPFSLACGTGGTTTSGGPGGCGDLCGCWTDVALNYSVTLLDDRGSPASGVTATCAGESTPISTAGADGVISFSIQTRESPGCSFERCRNINLAQAGGALEPLQVFAQATNGATVRMCPAGQQGGGVLNADGGVNCRP